MNFKGMNIFQLGGLSPGISWSTVCFGGKESLIDIEVDSIKKKIMKILEHRETLYITSLANELNINPRRIIIAIRELENEGLVKEV